MPRHLQSVSLVTNVVLLAAVAWLAPWSDFFGNRAPATKSATLSNASEIRKALDATALPVETRKRLLVAYLLLPESAQPEEYWRPMLLREARTRIAQYEASVEARATLTTLYGPNAVSDPVLAAAFRPLQRSLGEAVSAEKQVAIQEAMLGSLKQRASAEATATSASHDNGLRNLLNEDEYFEYELRESPLAKGLANRGFAFTETEFREAFRALRARSDALVAAGPGGNTASGPDPLKAALGDARFSEFQRTRDPIFGAIQAIGRKYDVAPQAMARTYAIVSQRWQNTREAGASSPGKGKNATWHGLSSQEREEIDRLMGQEGAKSLFQALERYGAALNPGGQPVRRMIVQDTPR